MYSADPDQASGAWPTRSCAPAADTDLPALAAQAPAEATLVVYHSAVLAYVTPVPRCDPPARVHDDRLRLRERHRS